MNPTMRDVADYARVSPMTVSRTLRDDPSVAPEKRSRVLAAVAALGYRRNEAARTLRVGGSTKLLGVVITNIANPFYAQLALGIEDHADKRGMRVVFANSGENTDRERQLVQDFAARRLDGIIAVPAANQHDHLDPAGLAAVPVVLAASPPHRINVDAVLLDDFGGTYEATSMLIARGHRNIGFLGLPAATWTGSERYRGYVAALEAAGLAVQDRFVRRNQPHVAAAVEAANAILDQPDPPTAVFAANNRNTIGAYRAIRSHGGTTALAGFDDFDFADLLDLPLIVVSYDAREIGRVAAELVCGHIDNPSSSPLARRVVIPTKVIDYPNAAS
ncbi:LacI family DNA-binding transcriptional regulator [Actinoplanes sp. NBRC 103695]|uniref:LacI family DNA-binding transcriptional regulator n=1 Tax=Actinoplanes sp. NBRC 103695 TaxID=3032202 RepID=UPI0025538406|nr:LacI family DNA-binding transcriptional regulator [Actinoplanes sp. NBRC 103695]